MAGDLQFRQAFAESTGHATTYQHKLKCQNCGLHFIVLSWNPEWPVMTKAECQRLLSEKDQGHGYDPRGTHRGTPVCPQCGNPRKKGTRFIHVVVPSEDPIFVHMAGVPRWMWVDGRRMEVVIERGEISVEDLDVSA